MKSEQPLIDELLEATTINPPTPYPKKQSQTINVELQEKEQSPKVLVIFFYFYRHIPSHSSNLFTLSGTSKN